MAANDQTLSPGAATPQSTQSTQYDQIGTRYNSMHDLPAVRPERPSVVKALGDLTGKRCLDLACGTGRYTHLLSTLGATSVHGYDISSVMISGALAAYPPSTYPTLHFAVADCSIPSNLPPSDPFDLIFAGWFLNYAGTESELVSMFRVIETNMVEGGRFVGITTNADESRMKESKMGFYGVDVIVLEENYVAPDTGAEVGIKARIRAHTDPVVQFDTFQLRREVYERCATKVGLRLKWRERCVPDDGGEEFWRAWRERPTFSIVEATRV